MDWGANDREKQIEKKIMVANSMWKMGERANAEKHQCKRIE